MSRCQKRFLECKQMTIQEAQQWGHDLAEMQRDIHFWMGDLARYAEARWPDTHHQIWPEWVSPGLLSRCAGVCRAYPNRNDRVHECTYTQYMQVAGKRDRHESLEKMVDDGLTSDESREIVKRDHPPGGRPIWMLAIDVNYYLHRFWFSGSGVESAYNVSKWIKRTVERLQAKGLSDVVCCFDSKTNHRIELTKDWEQPYKDRPSKDPELVQQLQLVRDLIEKLGYCCVSVPDMEADDCLASYAAQYSGIVTILSQDKDLRQCLRKDHCNMLVDVDWVEDWTSGDILPNYDYLSYDLHLEQTSLRDENGVIIPNTGIKPELWPDYQALMGDATDSIQGAIGIGEAIAAKLIRMFGSAEAAIEAAKADDERIKPKKRESLIEFESRLEITLQLVTLRTDLTLPQCTRV